MYQNPNQLVKKMSNLSNHLLKHKLLNHNLRSNSNFMPTSWAPRREDRYLNRQQRVDLRQNEYCRLLRTSHPHA
jgi:hypothetical protein